MEDLISVIVPVYKVEQYLEKCIESITNQTYKNLEIILVDDGSPDNCGKMCDEFARKDKRIKVIHKKNGGLSDARNFGLKVAKGKYIQFVDSDDYMDLDMIKFLYDNMKKYDCDISMCGYYIVKGNELETDCKNEKEIFSPKEAIAEFLIDKRVRAYAWNKLFKLELFKDVSFPVGRVFEDQLTIPKLFLKAKKIVFNNKPLYYYVKREGSILNTQTKELRIAYINAVFEIQDYIKNNITGLEQYLNYNISHVAVNTFNDIGLFKMYELLEDKTVNELYDKLVDIFKDKDMEKFIISNSENAKKIHYYYLLEDKLKYVKYNSYLPVIYIEHKDLAK